MSPLRIHRQWVDAVARELRAAFFQVDAHNIVPVWEASDKQEHAAYTIRPKINRRLNEFLTEFPRLKKHPYSINGKSLARPDWAQARKSLKVDMSVPEVDWIRPGLEAAAAQLDAFFATRYRDFAEFRNDPNRNLQTDLSPWLHFGQTAPQRVALEVQRHDEHIASQEGLLEQLVVRRELSDNFCWYNGKYDSVDAFPDWAQRTLTDHRSDPREHVYSREQFEYGRTHDELWNAAQHEMTALGKMHGYMRMYWAKKILQWSPTPEEALATVIYLNDKYELDGRDPNGYAGAAWSIGGVHDRPFAERDIFGKIRYMSYDGCKRKFDIAKYVTRIDQLRMEAAP
jgi:deoxyribodipyrimidine photo-lyase